MSDKKKKNRFSKELRCVAFSRVQFSKTEDFDNTHIPGISLITKTPPLGHGLDFDDKTMQTFMSCVQNRQLKSFINHHFNPDPTDAIGLFDNHRLVDDQALSDFTFFESFKTDETARWNRLCELIRKASEVFGVSVTSRLYAVWVEPNGREVEAQYDWWNGRWSGKPSSVTAEYPSARFTEVTSADFVSDPAANPTGIFNAKGTERVTFSANPNSDAGDVEGEETIFLNSGDEPPKQSIPIKKDTNIMILAELKKRFGSKQDQYMLAVDFCAENPDATLEQIDAHLSKKDMERRLAEADKAKEENEEMKKKLDDSEKEKEELSKKLSALDGAPMPQHSAFQGKVTLGSDPRGAWNQFGKLNNLSDKLAFMKDRKDAEAVFAGFKAFQEGLTGDPQTRKTQLEAAKMTLLPGIAGLVLINKSTSALANLDAFSLDFTNVPLDPEDRTKIRIKYPKIDPTMTDNDGDVEISSIAKEGSYDDAGITMTRCRTVIKVDQVDFDQTSLSNLENFAVEMGRDFERRLYSRINPVWANAAYTQKLGYAIDNFSGEVALQEIRPKLEGRKPDSILLNSLYYARLLDLNSLMKEGGYFNRFEEHTYWNGAPAGMVGMACVKSFAHVAARPTLIPAGAIAQYSSYATVYLGTIGLPVSIYVWVNPNNQKTYMVYDTMIGVTAGDPKAGVLIYDTPQAGQ